MSEELNTFIEEGTEPIVEMVLEESVSDAILYDSDDVVVEALNKYVEMLEDEDNEIDETFEENLSVLLYPFMENMHPMFEGVYRNYKAARRTASGAVKKNVKAGLDTAKPAYQNRGKVKSPGAAKTKNKNTPSKSKTFLKKMRRKFKRNFLVRSIRKGFGKAKGFVSKQAGNMKKAVSAGIKNARAKAGRKMIRMGAKQVLAGTS